MCSLLALWRNSSKANHSFDNNAEYELYDHPRFGAIKCLRARRDISAGDEITVHYGYEDNLPPNVDPYASELEAPDWYRALLRERQREALGPT